MPNSNFAKLTSRTLIVIAVVIAAMSGYSFYNYCVFCQRVAELKKAGEPVSLQDYVHEVEDTEQDAWTYLTRIPESAAEAFLATVTEEQESDAADLTDDTVATFLNLEATYPEFFSKLKAASECSDISVRFDENGNFAMGIVELQKLGRVMDLKTRILHQQGKSNEAIRNATQQLALADTIEELPTLLNYLLAVAFRQMAIRSAGDVVQTAAGIDSVVIEDLQVTLGKIRLSEGLIAGIKFERAANLDAFQGRFSGSADGPPNPIQRAMDVVPGIGAAFYGNNWLDQMEIALKHCNEPFTIQHEYEQGQQTYSQMPRILGDSVKLFDRLRNSVGQIQCSVQALQIVIALQDTEIPIEQTELTGDDLIRLGIPADTVKDPFTGRPMIVKRNRGQWQVFSLGPDLIEGENPKTKVNDDAGLGIRAMGGE